MDKYQELQIIITEIEKSLIKINVIEKGRNFWMFTLWIPMVILLMIWGIILDKIGVMLKILEGYGHYNILFIIILFICCMVTAYILYIAYKIHYHFPQIFSLQFKSIESLNKKLKDIDINNINNFEEIVNISNQIYEIENGMRKWRIGSSIFFFIYGISRKLKNLWILENQFLYESLIKIREKLNKEMVSQQSTLAQAKSELEENVTGTTELNSISELQQARLERQIEQFEELQRVLTKI